MPKSKGEFIAEAVQKRYDTIVRGERKAKAAADALEDFRAWICETCEEFFDLSDDLGAVAERLRRQSAALDARAALHSKIPYGGDGVDVNDIDRLETTLNAAKNRTVDAGTDFESAAIKIKLDEIDEIRGVITAADIDYHDETGEDYETDENEAPEDD